MFRLDLLFFEFLLVDYISVLAWFQPSRMEVDWLFRVVLKTELRNELGLGN